MISQRPLPAWIAVPLEEFQRGPLWLLFGVAVFGFTLPAFAFKLWYPSAACANVDVATLGWLSGTMQFQVFAWAVVLLALRAGGLRARHVGFLWSQVPVALATTILLWLLVQATVVVGQAVTGAPVSVNPGFGDRYISLVTQVFGVGPREDTFYIGFLLPQCYLWLRRGRRWSATKTLVVSLLVTQVFFAAVHIWVDLERGAVGLEMFPMLARRLLYGLFSALVWLRTGNLLLCAGFHGLSNEIMPLFVASEVLLNTSLVVWTGVLALLWRWPQRDRLAAAQAL